jgi:hypothetical protein
MLHGIGILDLKIWLKPILFFILQINLEAKEYEDILRQLCLETHL